MTEPQIIHWKRLSVEAAAIVASILLAFAIDALWDEHKDRQFEQETLVGLEAEYEDLSQAIVDILALIRGSLAEAAS